MTEQLTCADTPIIEVQLPHDRAAVPAARNSVTSFVAYAAAELADPVALAVSELATNAVVHTGGRFTLRAICTEKLLVVEVDDTDPAPPAALVTDELAQEGRGIDLVAAIADRWGTTTDGPGKTVWAAFDIVTEPPDQPT